VCCCMSPCARDSNQFYCRWCPSSKKGTKKTLTRLVRINNSYHTESWEQMSAIKSRILRIWDAAPAPVRLSCIKFAQRVVLAQTASNGMEQKVCALRLKRWESVADTGHPDQRPRHLPEYDPPEPPFIRSKAIGSGGYRSSG
jgi:hypothetical protein